MPGSLQIRVVLDRIPKIVAYYMRKTLNLHLCFKGPELFGTGFRKLWRDSRVTKARFQNGRHVKKRQSIPFKKTVDSEIKNLQLV